MVLGVTIGLVIYRSGRAAGRETYTTASHALGRDLKRVGCVVLLRAPLSHNDATVRLSPIALPSTHPLPTSDPHRPLILTFLTVPLCVRRV